MLVLPDVTTTDYHLLDLPERAKKVHTYVNA